MSCTVPSEIVEYLDSRCPSAKEQQETNKSPIYLYREHSAIAQHLLFLIENIPSHLMTLRGEDFNEFGEAVSEIRSAVSAWNRGENYKLEKVPWRDKMHPFTLVRKHLSSLKDEGILPTTCTLEFIKDEQLRDSLRRDISTVNLALGSGEWKGATVIAGSLAESLLLWAVQEYAANNKSQLEGAIESLQEDSTLKQAPPSDRNEWGLHPLIEVASTVGLIKKDTAAQCRIAKDFRNLIHPGRAIRLAQVCDRGTALSAVAAIEHIVRDFSNPPKIA